MDPVANRKRGLQEVVLLVGRIGRPMRRQPCKANAPAITGSARRDRADRVFIARYRPDYPGTVMRPSRLTRLARSTPQRAARRRGLVNSDGLIFPERPRGAVLGTTARQRRCGFRRAHAFVEVGTRPPCIPRRRRRVAENLDGAPHASNLTLLHVVVVDAFLWDWTRTIAASRYQTFGLSGAAAAKHRPTLDAVCSAHSRSHRGLTTIQRTGQCPRWCRAPRTPGRDRLRAKGLLRPVTNANSPVAMRCIGGVSGRGRCRAFCSARNWPPT